MKQSADRLKNELGFDSGHSLESAHRRGIEAKEKKNPTEDEAKFAENRERLLDR